jgi:hypothetical protein
MVVAVSTTLDDVLRAALAREGGTIGPWACETRGA